ncbi:Gamma-glutamyltranspeptidase (plasmid) [Rhodovulum sp. P5]|nr:Gamma-glutamyltranspeptidase [Rhodovulum sp. P5]
MFKSPIAVLVSLALAGAAAAQEAADTVAPEAASDRAAAFAGLSDGARAAMAAKQAGTPTEAQDWMIAAANPLAVEAGANVLRAGGSAADAMVAVQAVLGLVEPQSSGLGGGRFWSGTMRPRAR